MVHDFLPISRADMEKRGWEQCDFVYVIGDAYVDHPTFGHAIISRVLENAGFKVGIISQPDWKNPNSIKILGEPRLGFLVMGGNMDSMVNHYSVSIINSFFHLMICLIQLCHGLLILFLFRELYC